MCRYKLKRGIEACLGLSQDLFRSFCGGLCAKCPTTTCRTNTAVTVQEATRACRVFNVLASFEHIEISRQERAALLQDTGRGGMPA